MSIYKTAGVGGGGGGSGTEGCKYQLEEEVDKYLIPHLTSLISDL